MSDLPNKITMLRILLIPVFVLIFYIPGYHGHLAAAIIFTIAAFTDFLDGYLARNLKLETKLGAFLDPVADKLIVAMALVMLVGVDYLHGLVLPSMVIVGREIVVSALREWMAELGKRANVAVSVIGKFKTAAQMLAIVVLIYCTPDTSSWIVLLGALALYVAAALTLWSMIIYLQAAWSDLKGEDEVVKE